MLDHPQRAVRRNARLNFASRRTSFDCPSSEQHPPQLRRRSTSVIYPSETTSLCNGEKNFIKSTAQSHPWVGIACHASSMAAAAWRCPPPAVIVAINIRINV